MLSRTTVTVATCPNLDIKLVVVELEGAVIYLVVERAIDAVLFGAKDVGLWWKMSTIPIVRDKQSHTHQMRSHCRDRKKGSWSKRSLKLTTTHLISAFPYWYNLGECRNSRMLPLLNVNTQV